MRKIKQIPMVNPNRNQGVPALLNYSWKLETSMVENIGTGTVH
jgi:hypothetical protein